VFDVDPQYQLLEFWKRAEGSFPIVAEMAREFLAIPASGVGVERLFNQARDICTYRRHSLKPETVRLLVMLMCMDSFNLKEEYRLSTAANDLEDEWERVSENNDIDDSLSSYAISEHSEDYDILEDDLQYPQDVDIFGLPGSNLFDALDPDLFYIPDDLEEALADSLATQHSTPPIITTSLEAERYTTLEVVASIGSVTR
jgi:hypothetical protein